MQKELAEVTEIHEGYLRKVESGELGPPGTKAIKRIADYLNYNSDLLLLEAGEIPEDIKDKLTEDAYLGLEMLAMIRQYDYEDSEFLDE